MCLCACACVCTHVTPTGPPPLPHPPEDLQRLWSQSALASLPAGTNGPGSQWLMNSLDLVTDTLVWVGFVPSLSRSPGSTWQWLFQPWTLSPECASKFPWSMDRSLTRDDQAREGTGRSLRIILQSPRWRGQPIRHLKEWGLKP